VQLQNVGLINKLAIALIFVGVVLLIGHELELYLPDLEVWVQELGTFAPLGFIALFVVLTPLFASVDALCFAAGLLFPIGAGEFYIIIATYLASAIIFLLGRYLLRHRVLMFLGEYKRFSKLTTLVDHDAFKLMFLLRLTPLPFAILSYVLSVTQVRFWPYLAATTGILIYNTSLVYFGYTAKHLAGLVNGVSPHGSVSYPMLAMGFVISLAVLIYVAKIAGDTVKRLNLYKNDREIP